MKKIGILLIGILLIGGIYYYFSTSKKDTKKEKNTPIEDMIEDNEIKNSIFKKYYKEASSLVTKMTLEEKVGQLFLVRYNKEDTAKQKDMYPGGYVLFAKDFEGHTKSSIQQELAALQKTSKYPLIIGVDEEGGYVTRVSRFPAFRSEKFASPSYYYSIGGYEEVEKTELEKAKLLKEIGINLNLAPVADISTDENDFIYSRAFGKGAKETAEFIKNMVSYANQGNINSCLKHFPGYGNNQDTHTGIAIDERSYESFQQNDYLPFQAGIEEGVPSILVSHNIVKCLDSNYPASLSEKVVGELRNTLKFTGIIMTDDLDMAAVKKYVEQGEASTLAIQAGNDMMITSDFETMYQDVLNSVKTGVISEETLNKAVLRIMAWKYNSQLF